MAHIYSCFIIFKCEKYFLYFCLKNGQHFVDKLFHYLLIVGLRGDVAEADRGHAGHGVVKGGNVHRPSGRAPL